MLIWKLVDLLWSDVDHMNRLNNVKNPVKVIYKPQEEQHQEILELRKSLARAKEENASLKVRVRKLQQDLVKRDKQIEQLIDPVKNGESRRKLTDRGSSILSNLKLRISRLEAALRDKELELSKINASTKVTSLQETKTQAETYYQEIVRLRNILNAEQQQQLQEKHIDELDDQKSFQESLPILREGAYGEEFPSENHHVTLLKLKEENSHLLQELASITLEKNRLSADLEKVLKLPDDIQENFGGYSKNELMKIIEKNQDELSICQALHHKLSEVLSKQIEGDTATLQIKIAELRAREEEWEHERLSLKEFINTLKEDRHFYHDAAKKKEEELEKLCLDVQSLHKEVSALRELKVIQKFHSPRTPHSSHKLSCRNSSGSSSSDSCRVDKLRSHNTRQSTAIKQNPHSVDNSVSQVTSTQTLSNYGKPPVSRSSSTSSAHRVKEAQEYKQYASPSSSAKKSSVKGGKSSGRRSSSSSVHESQISGFKSSSRRGSTSSLSSLQNCAASSSTKSSISSKSVILSQHDHSKKNIKSSLSGASAVDEDESVAMEILKPFSESNSLDKPSLGNSSFKRQNTITISSSNSNEENSEINAQDMERESVKVDKEATQEKDNKIDLLREVLTSHCLRLTKTNEFIAKEILGFETKLDPSLSSTFSVVNPESGHLTRQRTFSIDLNPEERLAAIFASHLKRLEMKSFLNRAASEK